MTDPPGFKRVEKHGERIHYLGLPQDVGEVPRKLFMMTEVATFIETNQKRLTSVTLILTSGRGSWRKLKRNGRPKDQKGFSEIVIFSFTKSNLKQHF